MIARAIKSIKDDFSKSLFYVLTFVLTTSFMFLFFNLAMSDEVGVHFLNSTADMNLTITILVVAVSVIVINIANDFYVKTKSKEVAIQLVSGATFSQISTFVLFQTMILFLISMPLALGLSVVLLPFLNQVIILFFDANGFISILPNAIVSSTVIIFVELIMCTYLNVGYIYRSSIRALIDENGTSKATHFKWPFGRPSLKVRQITYTLLYVLPIIIFYLNYKNQESIIVLSIAGAIGLSGFLNNVILEGLDYLVKEKFSNNPTRIVYLGFIRSDLKLMKSNIIIIIISVLLSIALLVTGLEETMGVIMRMISFVVINLLLLMSIMFKFSSGLKKRNKLLESLEKIGYNNLQLSRIMIKEVIGLYALIYVLTAFYIVNIFINLYIHHCLQGQLIIGLIVLYTIPFILCSIVNLIVYLKAKKGASHEL